MMTMTRVEWSTLTACQVSRTSQRTQSRSTWTRSTRHRWRCSLCTPTKAISQCWRNSGITKTPSTSKLTRWRSPDRARRSPGTNGHHTQSFWWDAGSSPSKCQILASHSRQLSRIKWRTLSSITFSKVWFGHHTGKTLQRSSSVSEGLKTTCNNFRTRTNKSRRRPSFQTWIGAALPELDKCWSVMHSVVTWWLKTRASPSVTSNNLKNFNFSKKWA